MSQKRGVVTEVSAKDFEDNKTGEDITLYSFRIEGSNQWLRLGRNKPQFVEGDEITFDQKGQNVTNVTVLGPPAQGQGRQARSAPPASKGGNARDDYWRDKERRDLEREKTYREVDIPRMTFQASQDRAISAVRLALEHGAIELGQAKNKRLGNLLGYIDEVTREFYERAMNGLGPDTTTDDEEE